MSTHDKYTVHVSINLELETEPGLKRPESRDEREEVIAQNVAEFIYAALGYESADVAVTCYESEAADAETLARQDAYTEARAVLAALDQLSGTPATLEDVAELGDYLGTILGEN